MWWNLFSFVNKYIYVYLNDPVFCARFRICCLICIIPVLYTLCISVQPTRMSDQRSGSEFYHLSKRCLVRCILDLLDYSKTFYHGKFGLSPTRRLFSVAFVGNITKKVLNGLRWNYMEGSRMIKRTRLVIKFWWWSAFAEVSSAPSFVFSPLSVELSLC